MFSSNAKAESLAKLAALDRVQAVIEFDLDGRILAANENFLKTLGYEASEIIGQHHSMFVEPSFRTTADYTAFWDRLRRGEFQSGQFQRVGRNGREIWIEASYNPILDRKGKPCKIVKFATDITRQKAEDADRAGQIAAIRKAQAVIEFDLDGQIIDANDNFLGAVGYRLDEIKGRHHSMFVDAETRGSSAYAEFWAALNRGEYQAAQYRRFGKDGREIWIEASYNPILNSAGKPYKVVKFATDITKQITLLGDLRHMIDTNFFEIDQALGRSLTQSDEAINIASSTSGNMQAVAAAAEELATSVGEIAASMARSREATDSAFSAVSSVGGFTSRLSEATSNMGGIVGLIQNIAAQINLLALNATIESARAGDAGRGFAVVAQEVKNLASQAAKATDQIATEINGLQTISHDVVSTLENIKTSVAIMRDSVVTTAGAVEEQSAVTRDMSCNMQETADAVAAMSGNVTAISAAVSQVSTAVSATRDAARVLAR